MRIHVFNPEHDIALASHQARFTAPRAGRVLRHDLGFLPALWAADGDLVLVDDLAVARRALEPWAAMARGTLVDRTLLATFLRHAAAVKVCPWGWDLTLRHQLLDCGITAQALPSDGALEAIRRMSHRAWAARHLLPVLTACAGTVGEAWVATSTDEVTRLAGQLPQGRNTLMVKAPWSSSGRGVRPFVVPADGAGRAPDPSVVNWVAATIRRQGCVTAEPLYDRVADFGMEFGSDGHGGVHYLGLSLFDTTHGAYTGNLLATEDCKRKRLSALIPTRLLDEVKCRIISTLSPTLAHAYAGPLGIDMMVVRQDGRLLLHPCVELNLRRTMGHVALALSDGRLPLPATMRIAFDGNYHFSVEA